MLLLICMCRKEQVFVHRDIGAGLHQRWRGFQQLVSGWVGTLHSQITFNVIYRACQHQCGNILLVWFLPVVQMVGSGDSLLVRLRVWILAGTAGESSSLEFTLCADSNSMSVPPLCYRSSTWKPRSFHQKCSWQVTPKHAYTLQPTKS